jgi:hypothetical protein
VLFAVVFVVLVLLFDARMEVATDSDYKYLPSDTILIKEIPMTKERSHWRSI